MLQAQLGHLYNRVRALGSDKIAIAFSGGGDSTALLHALRDFPGVDYAFIIDHALRPESGGQTQASAKFAKALGYTVKVKKWDHDQPETGIQVKARAFRYAAMGDMCRNLGITHLLTAHTEDDQAETLLMRQARDTGWRGLAGMRETAYGPLWPALADVTLVRPLLNVSREALREYNHREALEWIEDPSNENQDFSRVRARKKLANDNALKIRLLNIQSENKHRLRSERKLFKEWMSRYGAFDPHGFIQITRVPPAELLLHLLRIASGTGGPIDAARRNALCESMSKSDFKAATLAGAWIVKTNDGFLITRDKVAVRGRRSDAQTEIEPVSLEKNVPYIWDGRFKITAKQDNMSVVPAYGYLQFLRKHTEIKQLFNTPEVVRGTLPIYLSGDKPLGFGASTTDNIDVELLATKRLSALWEIN